MRKLSLVLVAALAIFFAGCNKSKSENPSIADTSAKQMQPDDQAAANGDQVDQSASANADQGQAPTQDQAAQAAPEQNDQAAIGMVPAPTDNAGNNSSAQIDESQTSQAQVPALPDTGVAPGADNANPANPQ
jgi:hypothetical protein